MGPGLPGGLQDGACSYVYGPGLLSQTDAAGRQSYFLSDGLGSTRYLAGRTGSAGRFSYDVFGSLRYRAGSRSP